MAVIPDATNVFWKILKKIRVLIANSMIRTTPQNAKQSAFA
jgi:hypothetical protein